MDDFQITWFRLEQEIPFELEESFFWLLDKLKIFRFSFEHDPKNKLTITLFIWLPFNEWSSVDLEILAQSFSTLAKPFELDLPACKWIQVKDEDWNLSWKKSWEPDPVGKHILILPAWLDVPDKFLGRKIIRLDPGGAFGTGSHPSTRLCIEALENDLLFGKTIADVGCGSGILSLIALKLGAKCAFAVDTDLSAISATKINLNLNNFPENSLHVFLGSIEDIKVKIPEKKIDLIICNILAPVIKLLASGFEKIIGCNGKLILSGLLVNQIPEIQEFFFSLGWRVNEIKRKDQWALMVLTLKLS